MGYLPTLLVDATSTGRRVLLPLAPIAAAPSSTNKTSPRPVPQDSLHSLGASLETYVERSTLERVEVLGNMDLIVQTHRRLRDT
ncbi:hypothetical protein PISMIDRAFT_467875 [Pisolithus microcarpus 441]|uniref:Uncharacterized protein n=1 Tax=Pisolithus microcarpus 441 TaxID=765257 RepID=A0A0C9YDW6_9AGAM|nr:hypothetical protein PISMIDRAFT_467875 [Pisolithus microcarpus 441]